MSWKGRSQVGIGVVTLVIAAWAVLHQNGPRQERSRVPGRRSQIREEIQGFERRLVRGAADRPPSASPRLALPPGTVLEYGLETTATVSVTLDAGLLGTTSGQGTTSPPPQEIEQAISGVLRVVSYVQEGATYLLGYRFEEVSLSIRSGGQSLSPQGQAAVERTIREEVFAEMDARGKVSALWFPREMDPQVRVLLQSAVLQSSLTLPEADEAAWEQEEVDGSGRYVARYAREGEHRLDAREFARIRRTRGAWLHLFEYGGGAADGAQPAPSASTSGATLGYFDMADACWHAIEADEETRLVAGDVSVTAALSARLCLRSRTHDPLLAARASETIASRRGAMDRRLPGEGKETARLFRRVEDSQWRALLKGVGAESLIAELARLAANELADTESFSDAIEKLAALLRLEPSAADAVAAWLLPGRTSGEAARALVSALGYSGTREAQQVLVRVLGDGGQAPEIRETAVLALSFVEEPERDSEAALEELAGAGRSDPLTASAVLGLGVMAGHLSATEPDRSEALVTRLREWAERSTETERRRQMADALGNAGTPQALRPILGLTSDPDPYVRASAAFALRFLQGEEVDQRLGSLLADDSDPAVQVSVVQALAYRSGPACERHLEAGVAHPREEVRRAALDVLVSRMADDQAAQDRVRRICVEDASDQIRSQAQEALRNLSR